ncbi:hypothetical protein O3G_MSEX006914 [Manduca sexta]|uniref:Reverse transcriptase n=1 Tax=Manduca sexta TaxID=7130 RepID=A0A922CM25_MANSE|nr:hypothetical protein O3G_MSEX006914 [Manduca sexta]
MYLAEQNCLVLNPTKSKFIVLGSKKQVSSILSATPEIKIMGENIQRVETARNLGLTMDPELRFEMHIGNVIRNCFYRLKILYRFRQYLSEPLRRRLVDSLVLSRLNYCDVVYGPCLLSRTDRLIQRVQNACARFCFNIPRRSHVTSFLNDANILKMAARRDLHMATLLFGIFKKQSPKYLYDKIIWKQDNARYSLHPTTNPLSMPSYRTSAFRGSFKFRATRCWNCIPPPCRSKNSKHGFKHVYIQYLLLHQKQR